MTTKYDLITILGPTASGKTSAAVALASNLNGEILSADSRQVYRNMDIGTGKDLSEYKTPTGDVPVHLIDIAEAGDRYDLFRYVNDFCAAYHDIVSRNKQPVLCGGSGMYLDAVIRGYHLKPAPANSELVRKLEQMSHESLADILKKRNRLHNTTDTTDRSRLIRAVVIAMAGDSQEATDPDLDFSTLSHLVFGIDIPRNRLRERITDRLIHRLENGMIEEVEELLGSGVAPDQLRYYGLEYRYITDYCTGLLSLEAMTGMLNTAIHQFAKRQMTWFRRMEKNNIPIQWIQGDRDVEKIINEITMVINH